VLAAGGIGWFGYLAWIKASAMVTLDETGVRWREGTELGSLPWDRIEGLKFRQRSKSVEWDLVEKGTGTCHTLPFMPRTLFVALKERSRTIPPQAEDRLFQ
jgi:hypothetical protein